MEKRPTITKALLSVIADDVTTPPDYVGEISVSFNIWATSEKS